VLVIERHLPRTKLDGAATLDGDGTPIIGMTIRYDRIDNFWFTLLHELAHIKLHLGDNSEETFIDDLDYNSLNNQKEIEADHLASDSLIPREYWETDDAFIFRTPQAVRTLAEKLGINPAIVAGSVRRQSGNYNILSQMIGRGHVRGLFVPAITD